MSGSIAKTSSVRRLIVLGSTGSIGVNTLKVAEHLKQQGICDIEVVGLAAGRNVQVLIEQARRLGVPAVAVAHEPSAEQVRQALPGCRVYCGSDAALKLVEENQNATDLSAAIVGSAGLAATLCAAKRGMRIGLANKETLVAAGSLVTPAVRGSGASLLPVDSEHSAIFQCLAGIDRDKWSASIKRIVLTASGGPFRTVAADQMRQATVEQALKHPTWQMGAKITIDSASMMNKALEIIEAHWLFDLPGQKISVIVHPQSVAHSFVEFMDNSVLAQMGPPDMKTPIQYALTYPDRPAGCSQAMDWAKLAKLEFEPPDMGKFTALPLAYEVIEAGGTAGAIFNAANEAAVAAFLDRRILFGQIVELVTETLSAMSVTPADSLETILQADRQARAFVQQRLAASRPLISAPGHSPGHSTGHSPKYSGA